MDGPLRQRPASGLCYQTEQRGRRAAPKPSQCSPSRHGGNQCRDKPSREEKREVKICLGGVVFKERQVFSEPPGGGSANMSPGPGPAAPPGTGAGRACSDQTEQTPSGPAARSTGPTADSESVNPDIRPQHSHFRGTGETAVLSQWSRGCGTPGSEQGGSLNTLGRPFPSPLTLSLKWAAEFSSSYMT